ncbi:MAG: sugar transferase, partial [Paracoccaceae bacterium]
EMSLMGPRAFTPDQRALYDTTRTNGAYYRLRPGISGLWQVKTRNNSVFAERVNFDEEYACNVTLWGDLKISARTVLVILRSTGN